MSYVEIENLKKQFGDTIVLSNIDMSVQKGEFITLLGPSGCGKSTILRILSGLTDATSGSVQIDGKEMKHVPPKKREVGMVFQSYALFPNMTVKENIAFGLKMKKVATTEIDEQVQSMLEIIRLTDKVNAYPHELSGGQQQRVALARSLIVKPKVLLLDEPLSALDAQIRKKLQMDLRVIQQEMGMTMMLVTHDQEEAMSVSDKIFVMNQGKIEQCGTPTEIYTKPKSEFIANFIGHYNVFDRIELEQSIGKTLPGTAQKFAIRPEAIQVESAEQHYVMTGTVKEMVMNGNVIRTVFEQRNRTFSMDQLHQDVRFLEQGKQYQCYVNPKEVIPLQ